MCPFQDLGETYLCPYRSHFKSAASIGTSWVSRGRSTVNQVTLLTQDIEKSFSTKKKAGAVFIDLTAAYDTVWHRSLTCKLLRLLPDRYMVSLIMELV